jgi:hypothetical protein
MPNGRSGGFVIPLTQFREVLEGLPGDSQAGTEFFSRSVFGWRRKRVVTVAEFARRLERYAQEKVGVEEQDHTWYIVHLGPNSKKSIVVDKDSVLYEAFRSFPGTRW